MNIHKIRCEKLRISLSDIKLLQNVLKMFKNVDEHLFKFWIWSGAKVCKSWRYLEKMLQNDYLDAKIGLDTAERAPSKVCRYKIGSRGGGEAFSSLATPVKQDEQTFFLLWLLSAPVEMGGLYALHFLHSCVHHLELKKKLEFSRSFFHVPCKCYGVAFQHQTAYTLRSTSLRKP